MKRILSLLTVILIWGVAQTAFGQFREQPNDFDYTGTIVKEDRNPTANWADRLSMTMSHSYSMSFASVGGQYMNLNMYTNTMKFDLGNKLDARVDLSVAHSPFGPSSFMSPGQTNNGTGAQFFVRNAELNYQISEKASIHLQFQQIPGGLGYSPFLNNGGYYGRSYFDPYNPFYR
jgi:hypothetical protein